ncbi:MAG TPA: DNA adenine methylase [Pyrinomonadaceae bacterium]|nr:DNA adenine methylase [Pyrinomonadaceae bacterium]
MIRSPLRYPGGKSRAVEKIVGLIPSFDEFREPFVGGGSISVFLKQKFPAKKFWMNDIYRDLIVFWQQNQLNSEKLIEQIWSWKNEYSDGKSLHKFLRDNKENFNEIELAATFFIFNRITFSGTTEAGGFSNQAYQKRFTNSSIERLVELPKVLREVKITNLDYEEVVNAGGENVFLFLDPPYFSATDSALYGKNGQFHKIFDHERFAKNLRKCQHKWLITYDDSPYIRELFSFAKITAWNLTYGMRNVTESSDQIGKELFISNYSLPMKDEKTQITLPFNL